MMEEILITVLISSFCSAMAAGGGAFITIAVLKNDIGWIKNIQEQHGKRIRELEIGANHGHNFSTTAGHSAN